MLESQKILLQLIKELDEICKRHDITYYLIGGSALGAVRHHGFIPWDDDMDIVMDHENYMKFVEVMSDPANLPPNRAYEDPFIEPYTQLNVFGRYSATNTTCIFDVLCFTDSVHGIKVDVFHLIPCPDDGPERDAFLEKYHVWAELCHPWARNWDLRADDYRASIEELYRTGVKDLRQRLFDDLEIEKYTNASQYIYCYEKLDIFYNKDVFKEPVYFPFEDTVLPVPTKYAEHFRVLFGDDWFCIPDVDEQISHAIALDVNRGYEEYTSDYYSYALSSQEEMYQEHKYAMAQQREKHKEVVAYQVQLRKPLVEKKLALFWDSHAEAIQKSFDNGDYTEVLNLAKPYLDEQLSPFAAKWDLFYAVDQVLLKYVALSSIYLSDNKKARKLLRFVPDSYCNDDINTVLKFLREKDDLIEMEENGEDAADISEANEKLLSQHVNDRDLHLRKARHLLKDTSENHGDEIRDICHQFSGDGDFIEVLAKLAEKEGASEDAVKLYEEAIRNTKNGMVILESNLSLQKLQKEGVQ